MSLWEYKVITSGKGGFATPALLEKFLNDLGREEWEIVHFHSQPDNFLAFTGLARRSTQRDWTLEDAAAAAAKAEADKLRMEFEAKFKAATNPPPAADEASAAFLQEKVAPDDGFRKLIDTSHDDEVEEEETKEDDDWDKLSAEQEDELPTFFDAIKPHMRRNQRGPGMSVGVDYLAKKWDQSEEDLKGALVECGFTLPEDEDAKPEYLEFEGDLYWININRRGELWINTKEKPRPVFRAVKAQKIAVEDESKPESPRAEDRGHKAEEKRLRHEARGPQPAEPRSEGQPVAEAVSSHPATETAVGSGPSLPAGPELLEKIRPMMRRNRRGPGGSGSTSFLSRALKCREADLVAAFKSMGLTVPTSPNEKPTNVEINHSIWWVNVDSRGNVWINGRDQKPGETVASAAAEPAGAPAGETLATASETMEKPAEAETLSLAVVPDEPGDTAPLPAAADAVPTPEAAPAASGETVPPPSGSTATLATVRPLLKETRTGSLAGKLERVADALGRTPDELVALLLAAGLAVPEKPREKPVFAEHEGEIFWLNRNAKGELWLNAKPSKFADKKSSEAEGPAVGIESGTEDAAGEKKSRRPRGRKKADAGS